MVEKKNLFKYSASLIFVIFVLHFLATNFYWYYSMWYFDMFMHFLGGLWLGFVFLWFFGKNNLNLSLIFKIIFGILIVGIGWEIFEFYFVNYVAENSFDRLDTLSDIFFDLFGGLSAVIYSFFIYKNIMSFGKNKI
jgi:uncharacterized membrane protein YjdF